MTRHDSTAAPALGEQGHSAAPLWPNSGPNDARVARSGCGEGSREARVLCLREDRRISTHLDAFSPARHGKEGVIGSSPIGGSARFAGVLCQRETSDPAFGYETRTSLSRAARIVSSALVRSEGSNSSKT